jgi:hypothetical protein
MKGRGIYIQGMAPAEGLVAFVPEDLQVPATADDLAMQIAHSLSGTHPTKSFGVADTKITGSLTAQVTINRTVTWDGGGTNIDRNYGPGLGLFVIYCGGHSSQLSLDCTASIEVPLPILRDMERLRPELMNLGWFMTVSSAPGGPLCHNVLCGDCAPMLLSKDLIHEARRIHALSKKQ